MDVFLNGAMTPAAEAVVSVEDAGFTHAVGLFETMAARHGRVFRLDAHLDRLKDSAMSLGLVRDLDREALAEAVRRTLRHNDLADARVRLTLTAGQVSLLRGKGAEPAAPTVLVVATPPIEYDPRYFEEGVMAVMGPAGASPLDPMAGHKTLNYWARLRSLRQAAAAGGAEVIWLNITNHLAGGAVSNLLLVKDGALLSPYVRGEEEQGALPAPVLPGVTRAVLLEIAASLSIPVQRRMLTINDLLEADEVMLTNSGWGVLPVTKVEKKAIADGKVGPMTAELRRALLTKMDEETQVETEVT